MNDTNWAGMKIFTGMVLISGWIGLFSGTVASQEMTWRVGAAKIDVTPEAPVRLSGYASRTQPTAQVDDRLFARALILDPIAPSDLSVASSSMKTSDQALVLVSIDAIGLSPVMTENILQSLVPALGVHRSRIVFCTTHSHTAPHLVGVIPNLFAAPFGEAELSASQHYTDSLVAKIIDVVKQAASKLQPGAVGYGLERAEFAINRRMLKDKQWVAIGTVDEGPVDRNVRILRVSNSAGEPIAVAYQYACHCTSISPEANRISGDWAGISAASLEERLPNCIALPIIGCGADANPNPRGTIENARSHGSELCESVLRAIKNPLKPLPKPTLASFTLVALAPERPTPAKLQEMQSSGSAHERNFANHWLGLLQHKDRIPESYPAPVHYWAFGNELAWVFMGGEVVVDYQIRLERELSHIANVWVAGYVDDVFAYVASERVRGEGGYEVDGSMLYYQQPGRWVSGTEETIVGRILQMSRQTHPAEEPMSPEDSLASIAVPDGWTIELVAAEPLVTDPVNIAFGADGTVWVVEMGDYPLGGERTGRIKTLVDTDGDGKLDKSTVFLDGLDFPAGVYAWRDGAVIACAPEIFFARDRNGDGVCDERITLMSGFPEGNPQHRVHGFTYGLDHRLYFGPGGGADRITVSGQGLETKSPEQTFRVAGSDISLDPDTATMRLETGVTQYIRATDDWGNWFGNENSLPMFHYVYPQRWMERVQAFPRRRYQLMTDPPSIPPVFPISQQADRFNDLYAVNRFTSACSTIINRGAGQGEEMRGYALVCEPVHNLVARFKVEPKGATWSAERIDADSKSEFIRSRDPWFRPVRIENAPDGSLWIVDMYRYVIEHPEWIPDEWQRRINVRAGEDRGRIYRIRRTEYEPRPFVPLVKLDDTKLVSELLSQNSSRADLAQQELIQRFRKRGLSEESLSKIRQGMLTAFDFRNRARALSTLLAIGKCTSAHFELLLGVGDAPWLEFMLRQIDRMPHPESIRSVLWKKVKPDRVRESPSLALAMAVESSFAAQSDEEKIAWALATHAVDRWVLDGTMFLAPDSIDGVLASLLVQADSVPLESSMGVHAMIEKMLPRASPSQRARMLSEISVSTESRPSWHYALAQQWAAATSGQSLDANLAESIREAARSSIRKPAEPSSSRLAAIQYLISRLGAEWGPDHDLLLSIVVNKEAASHSDAVDVRLVQELFKLGGSANEKLIDAWSELSIPARRSLLSELIAKPDRIGLLMSAVEERKIGAAEFDAASIEKLRSSTRGEWAAKVIQTFGPAPGSDRVEVVRNVLANWPERTAKSTEAVEQLTGRLAYEKHCAVCHEPRQGEEGAEESLAPALRGLVQWTNEAWLTAILDPNRAVEEKYRSFQGKTEDGELITGLKLREDESSIEWVNTAGRVNRLDKSQWIEFQVSEKSLMPEGFEQLLKPEELAGIIRYLRSEKDR
ncbi:MAG: neutral/alkaline non-lysosomal ceramidase N-terminal domain-containing protein [Planctomycetota bacterium]